MKNHFQQLNKNLLRNLRLSKLTFDFLLIKREVYEYFLFIIKVYTKSIQI